jgi:hypothetical protein
VRLEKFNQATPYLAAAVRVDPRHRDAKRLLTKACRKARKPAVGCR